MLELLVGKPKLWGRLVLNWFNFVLRSCRYTHVYLGIPSSCQNSPNRAISIIFIIFVIFSLTIWSFSCMICAFCSYSQIRRMKNPTPYRSTPYNMEHIILYGSYNWIYIEWFLNICTFSVFVFSSLWVSYWSLSLCLKVKCCSKRKKKYQYRRRTNGLIMEDLSARP